MFISKFLADWSYKQVPLQEAAQLVMRGWHVVAIVGELYYLAKAPA